MNSDSKAAKDTPAEETFRTPEEIAAEDDVEQPEEAQTEDEKETDVAEAQTSWRQRLNLRWPPSRQQALVGGVVLLFIAFVTVLAINSRDHSGLFVIKSLRNVVKPQTEPSTLTGLQVDPSVNDRPVTAIMIENSPDARPQSGLGEAGVVFEAIAEGGITRFLALYQDTAPVNIGPVRSARPYYIQWALGFDAAYAHVGGSPEALRDIRSWKVKDLDQFYNSGAYHRITSRYAPHNVYTSIKALNQLEKSKGYNHSEYDGLERLDVDTKAKLTRQRAGQLTATKIDLELSGGLYDVRYDYNSKTHSYDRSEGGAAHIDANGNKRISPTVVIAIVTDYGIQSDGHHSDYRVNGHGKVYIFQNGKVSVGTWAKKNDKSQLTFADSKGSALKLMPGKTWLTAVSASSKVHYTAKK